MMISFQASRPQYWEYRKYRVFDTAQMGFRQATENLLTVLYDA